MFIIRTAVFSVACMWHGASHARCVIAQQRCVHVAEPKVAVSQSAVPTDTRSVCIIRTTAGQYASCVWSPQSVGLIRKIKSVQRR